MDDQRDRAEAVARTVTDPELPMLTLADLGVLREVRVEKGRVLVTLTPTYTGCPATAMMQEDLASRLGAAGFPEVEVRISWAPPWSTDLITAHGRATLARHGISPPGPASAAAGPVPLSLGGTRRYARCPRCASDHVGVVSEFGPTACTALYRCEDCGEPFEHMKEV